jgi:hypothetical protein
MKGYKRQHRLQKGAPLHCVVVSERFFPKGEEPHSFITNQNSRPISAVKERPSNDRLAICESERFASFTMCATINLVMSALIFTGDLQEVLPGKLAVRGNRGERCAVCETCKALICKVLR